MHLLPTCFPYQLLKYSGSENFLVYVRTLLVTCKQVHDPNRGLKQNMSFLGYVTNKSPGLPLLPPPSQLWSKTGSHSNYQYYSSDHQPGSHPLWKKENLAEHRASGTRFHPVLVTSSKSFSSQMHRSHQTLCAQASSEAPASQPTPGKQGFPRKWRLRGGQ